VHQARHSQREVVCCGQLLMCQPSDTQHLCHHGGRWHYRWYLRLAHWALWIGGRFDGRIGDRDGNQDRESNPTQAGLPLSAAGFSAFY
jgi:hypothetical protein